MSQFENNAKCFFLYFMIAILSIIVCSGVDGIWTFIIEKEAIDTRWPYNMLRLNIAFLFIGFPFLLIFLYTAQRNLMRGVFSVMNTFRRWILYGTLAIAAFFIFYELVHIFVKFLDGTLLASSLMKFGISIAIASIAFVYYLIDVTRKQESLTGIQKGMAVFSVLGIMVTFYGGLSQNKTKEEIDKIMEKHKTRSQLEKSKNSQSEKSKNSK